MRDRSIAQNQPVFPLDLYKCGNCGLVQLMDVVDLTDFYKDYIYETVTSPGLVDHYRKYFHQVCERLELKPGDSVVEFGCNDGTLLRQFRDMGMRVSGVDPAEKIVERMSKEHNLDMVTGYFGTDFARRIVSGKGKAKLVAANMVLADIDDLKDIFDAVRMLLDDDGVFIIETGYLLDFINNRIFDNNYHEHICHFSVKPLAETVKNLGLEVFSVERVDSKGGSIRVMMQLAGGPRKVDPGVAELISLELKEGIYSVECYKEFSMFLLNRKTELLSLLQRKKESGHKVIGYGASTSVTTFLYQFGLGSYVDFLVDDNNIKHNMFSPGYGIPVYPSDEIYKHPSAVVVILAWRFYEKMIGRHRRFLDNGGEFVIPMPEVRLVTGRDSNT
jgi:SAM-dependent methyltransferase